MAMAFYHSYTLVQGKEHSCPAVDYGDDTVLLNKQGQCGPSVSKQYTVLAISVIFYSGLATSSHSN